MKANARTTGKGSLWQAGLGLSLATATLAVTVTGAVFTDSTDLGDNSFDTGNVEITTSATSDLVSFTSPKMMPGDSVVDDVTVTNAGTNEMRYAISSVTSGSAALAAQLDLTVWAESAEADEDGDCEAPASALYGAGDLGSADGVDLVGNPAQGGHLGDRTLAATDSEKLCFKVELPVSTGNSYEGLSADATFTFAAEQTANNA